MDPITNFFASLYEWFGLNPLYNRDLGDHLRGYDITCDPNFIGTHWYSIIGFTMLGLTILFYMLQYHILDNLRFNKLFHWWVFALILFSLNLFIGIVIPYNSIQADDYCNQLVLTLSDCIGFGFSNAVWSFVFFILITSFKYPKQFANNCRYTTFWKP